MTSALIPVKSGGVVVAHAKVDPADFERLNRYSWQLTPKGYARTKYEGRQKLMHRVVCPLPEGFECVDHIDRDRLNNTSANLRPVTHQQNRMNAVKHVRGSSQYKGVSFDAQRGKWRADCTKKGAKKLTVFADCEHEAARLYDMNALALHGAHALLNFPSSDYLFLVS